MLRYRAWHVNRIPLGPNTNEEDDNTHQDEVIHENDMDEWEMLSCLVPPNTVQVSDINTLGRRDFDLIHAWNSTTGSNSNLEDPTYFIKKCTVKRIHTRSLTF